MTVLDCIPTGCKKIDEVLDGGIPNQEVTMIYGAAETGKSTFVMQCAVNCARYDHKTLFVDCDGTFSARRISQVASQDFEEIAKLIILMKPKEFSEQTVIIEQLADYITSSFGLIAIDTITSLYSKEISEYPKKTFQLNREINRQMALLAQTAKTQKIVILTTSQVRSAFTGAITGIEPVATRVLKFWSDTVITLNPTKTPQIVKAILEKTSRKVKRAKVNLRIDETGIH
ncbi:MAG: ATPase domain-containing protein [Candidatus Bathyarchaeota archaeon]|jgi:DNA repair protein RadB